MLIRRVLRAGPLLRQCDQRAPASTQAYDYATERRPDKNVVCSPIAPQPIPKDNLPTLLYERLNQWRDYDATECVVSGRKYTYGDILDKGLRWGGIVNSMLNTTSSPFTGKTVAIYMSNAPEFPIVLLGTLACGEKVVTVNSNYTAEEVARQLGNSDADMVVTEPRLENTLTEAFTKMQKKLPVVVNGDSGAGNPNLRHLLDDSSRPFCDLVETPQEETAVILYSSGTTGPPKGVELSHRAFVSNLSTFTHPYFYAMQPLTDYKVQDVVTGVLPFYHIYGLYVINLMNLYMGAKIVTFPAFDPDAFTRVIREHGVRIVHLVPPMLNYLTMSDRVTSDDLASVRGAMCAAAPVPSTTAKLFKEKAPHPVIFQEGFGMTETLGVLMTPMEEETLGYCGKVIPNTEAKVVDENGDALPEGERGELLLKGPSFMTCYYKNPEATAHTLDAEGWLHTGDVAVHRNGFFSIVDRIKELIKVKGMQVAPSELEDLLLQHPGVRDVAVVGVPDDRAGELPRAYIVKDKDTCSENDVHRFLEKRVADFKQLRGGVRFVDALPKNQTGKVVKKELMAMAANES